MALFNIAMGPVSIPLRDVLRLVLTKFSVVNSVIDIPVTSATILYDIRLPNMALIALTGMALAGSGAAGVRGGLAGNGQRPALRGSGAASGV